MLTPNEHEVRAATRIEAGHDTEADRAGRVALEATGGEAVLVTRSAKGLTLVCRDAEAIHLPTRAREVADVSGAGDTLVMKRVLEVVGRPGIRTMAATIPGVDPTRRATSLPAASSPVTPIRTA